MGGESASDLEIEMDEDEDMLDEDLDMLAGVGDGLGDQEVEEDPELPDNVSGTSHRALDLADLEDTEEESEEELDDPDEEDELDLEDYQEHAEDMYDHDDEFDEDDEFEGYGYDARRVDEAEFAGVEMILPRRSFRGAKNVQTVKDCMSPLYIALSVQCFFTELCVCVQVIS